jgi:hypothetical protein
MHGVNISNHTWGQTLRNEARITENIALYYHVFVLLTALNKNDVQPPSTLTAAKNSLSNLLQLTIPTIGWCVQKTARSSWIYMGDIYYSILFMRLISWLKQIS